MEGLTYLKAKKPEQALEHLSMARNFDKRSAKIYIARGCALANMVAPAPVRITSLRG